MLGLKSRQQLAEQYVPMADYGFFGPDSVVWKVWSYPTSFMIGFARATSIEYLDPNLAAAAMQSGGVRNRTHNRYDRTVAYFSLGVFGPALPAVKAADVLVKVHSKAIGHDPVTGGTYDANNPSSQLWIHMTAWHSILKAYEEFGLGKLPLDEENQYWDECARSAALTTIDPDDVPRSRDAVREYFATWRPRLAISEDAAEEAQMILGIKAAMPPGTSRPIKAGFNMMAGLSSQAILQTYPKHIQNLIGVRPNPLLAPIVKPIIKASMRAFEVSPLAVKLSIVRLLTPSTVNTVAPMLLEIPPVSDKIWDPREAQAAAGVETPAMAHAGLRAKQRDKVFGKGEKSSDEGLLESQSHWGGLTNYDYA